ncbi:hypothetical protein M378DRAFT_609815 [Amanita muscaria Koide BX008]|uniref:Uncharacterized protein n=1 Tax=Amanita muscaria (strain Koide BX008) TaxID=946122 RepID=A0A0C2T2W9_AMAMK|nr:hypothetical protein M378DRAFT_609815 [Amanita muscaria Koide BX008]
MAVAIYPISEKPAPVPRFNLPLILPLFILTCVSLLFSLILFILSMLDLGYLSMWMNPTMALITIIFHVTVLVLSRKRAAHDSTFFSAVVVCAYLLGVVWFVAFILTNIVAAVKSDRFFGLDELKGNGLPATIGSQRGQIILTLFETVVLEAFAIKGHLAVREKNDPEDWRPRTGQQ